jgi:hypothetical protein
MESLLASVISGAVKQATGALGGDIPITDPLDGVQFPPNYAGLVICVNSLDALRAKSFSSEEERKAAVLPDLLEIRGAIRALPEDRFKLKLMPLVERIDAFSK